MYKVKPTQSSDEMLYMHFRIKWYIAVKMTNYLSKIVCTHKINAIRHSYEIEFDMHNVSRKCKRNGGL